MRVVLLLLLLLAGAAVASADELPRALSVDEADALQMKAPPADPANASPREGMALPRFEGVDAMSSAVAKSPGPDAAFSQLLASLSAQPPDAGPAFDTALAAWQKARGDCAHPLLDRYFRSRFPLVAATSVCPTRVPFLVESMSEGLHPVWIDPRQVRAIHLLYVSSGGGAASRFGHVALRLVVCPDSQSSDADCNTNVLQHLVIGFVAHVDAFEISMMKGLTGYYRAHLFAGRFMDAYQEYAIGEFRDIYSLPLELTRDEREDMVRGLSQIHWQYDGSYTFFGRNCTSLLQRALRALLPAHANDEALAVSRVRPDHFYRAMRDSTLTDSSRVADLPRAEREGFYFPGVRPYYEKAAALLGQTLNAPYRSPDDYLALSPAERKAIFDRPDNVFRLRADPHLAEAGVILEELALVRAERRFISRLAKAVDEQAIAQRAPALRGQLSPGQQEVLDRCLLGPLQTALQPVLRREGIPAAGEIQGMSVAGMQATCVDGDAPVVLREVLHVVSRGDDRPWEPVVRAVHDAGDSLQNALALRELAPGT